jgi:hypothetical protein
MQQINVLNLQRISVEDRAKIAAVDPVVRLTDAGGWFDGEYRETWPAFTSARYLPPDTTSLGTRKDRDRLLADAEVILGGWPFRSTCVPGRQSSSGFISALPKTRLRKGETWRSRLEQWVNRGAETDPGFSRSDSIG